MALSIVSANQVVWGRGVGPVAQAFAIAAIAAADDATQLYRTVSGLAGNYGRYFPAGDPLLPYRAAATTVARMIAQNAQLRAAVTTAAAALTAAADAVSFGIAATAVVGAVRAAAALPSDALRALESLIFFTAPAVAGDDDLASAARALAADAAWVCRRLAGIGLGRALRDHVPNSYQDAARRRDRGAAVLDALGTMAADRFDDRAWHALEALRDRVVADLTARGGSLEPIVEKTLPQCLPASVAAWRLYHDATRASDLVARNDPPHPGFLPARLEALAS